jgi:predicted DNA-binding transcriptional regulator YafY
MIESADTINTLRIASDINRYMIFEKRRAQGTHHFRGLLYAIRNRVVIELDHQKFDDENPRTRLTEPYALKESQGRWYLVARDRTDHHIKTFGLDRIIGFRNTPRRFDYPEPGVTDRLFQSCFGVINPSDSEPEEILLEFGPEQGKYIKSYPIHESQVVLSETEKEVRIRLYLHITYDLIMELLSYGDRIGIISPESLRYRLAEIHRNSLKRLT